MSLEICVEGVNGSGKSTLTSFLNQRYDLPVRHPGPKPSSDQMAVDQCVEQLNMSNVIYDRITSLTRQIYGDVKENVHGLSHRHIDLMNHFLDLMIEKNVIFIHTIGQGEHIIKPYYTEYHIQQITKNRDNLRARYFAIFKRVPHFSFDFKTQQLEEVVEYVETYRAKLYGFPESL